MVSDLTKGIFKELKSDDNTVNIYRRNLQREYLTILIKHYSGKSSKNNDLQSISRFTTLNLKDDLKDAFSDANETIHKAHYLDLLTLIKESEKK